MHHRAYLLSALTAASTITAGCGSPAGDNAPSGDNISSGDGSSLESSPTGSRIEHTEPTTVGNNDGRRDIEKYLQFHGDRINLPTVGVDPGGSFPPSSLLTTVSHSENTELRSLTQRYAPSNADGTPLRLSDQVSFTGEPDARPAVSVSNNGQTAIVEIQQFGELANETVFLSLPVTRWPEAAHRLVVSTTVELAEASALNQRHVFKGRLEFEFTGKTETNG